MSEEQRTSWRADEDRQARAENDAPVNPDEAADLEPPAEHQENVTGGAPWRRGAGGM